MFARCYIETDAVRGRPARARRRDRAARRAAGRARLLHRHVLRAVALRAAVQRCARRRDPRRDRARLRRLAARADPAHQPRSRPTDRVDSTTGLQMAYVKQWAPRSVGAAGVAGPGPPRRRRAGRSAPTRSAVTQRRSGSSTSPTSTRRTTSTGTSRTTTCGRRSWRGMRPRTTASRASGSTPAIRRPRACST